MKTKVTRVLIGIVLSLPWFWDAVSTKSPYSLATASLIFTLYWVAQYYLWFDPAFLKPGKYYRYVKGNDRRLLLFNTYENKLYKFLEIEPKGLTVKRGLKLTPGKVRRLILGRVLFPNVKFERRH